VTFSFRSGDIRINTLAGLITVGLGRKFVLGIDGTLPASRIRWTTETDPVLDLREAPDKLSAKVVATAIGMSTVFVKVGRDEYHLHVSVVPMHDTSNEAVTLGASIGTESPDT